LKTRLLVAARAASGDGQADVPTGTAYGDAFTRNLLVSPDTDGFVLINHSFWCRAPLAFDLGQLLLGEVADG
jgi:hypothetical protein